MNGIKVKIEKISDFPIAGEKFITFSLNGENYEAFHHKHQDFKEGKKINVKLSLIAFKEKKTNKEIQSLEYIKTIPQSVNSYKIYGKVIRKENGIAAIDAGNGFIFEMNISDVKQGDYIYVEGRLDINKAGDYE